MDDAVALPLWVAAVNKDVCVYGCKQCASASVANDWAVHCGSESPRQVAVALVSSCLEHWWITCLSRARTACRAKTGERSVGSAGLLGLLTTVWKRSEFDVCLWCVSSTGRQRRSRSGWKRRQSNWFVLLYFCVSYWPWSITALHFSFPNTRPYGCRPLRLSVHFDTLASNDSAETFRNLQLQLLHLPESFFFFLPN